MYVHVLIYGEGIENKWFDRDWKQME